MSYLVVERVSSGELSQVERVDEFERTQYSLGLIHGW